MSKMDLKIKNISNFLKHTTKIINKLRLKIILTIIFGLSNVDRIQTADKVLKYVLVLMK